jgi:spermidine synthase
VPVATATTGGAASVTSARVVSTDALAGAWAALTGARLSTLISWIFVLSGAAGLIYEVVWARQLVLVFGNTTQAISTILTGFFAGMALGSFFGGRLADRVRQPLRLYGAIELVLVVVVVLTPVLFRGITEVYRGLYPGLENDPALLALVRFGLALLALGPATVLMGATLPTLSRYLTRDHASGLGLQFGRLYLANTLGAIFGAAISGYVLIEVLGLTGSLVVGAACSATAGASALALAASRPRARDAAAPVDDEPAAAVPPRTVPTASERRLPPRWVAFGVAFVSGLTSLGYQVLWTRLLSSGSGNSTYIFTTILLMFLIGIAGGAALFMAGFGRRRNPLAVLAWSQLAVAGIALIGIGIISGSFAQLPLTQEMLLVVLPGTLVMGLSLPIAAGIAAQHDRHVGSDTGSLLAVNTGGIVVATFVIPFLFVPAIGSPRSVAVLATANALLGAALLVAASGLRRSAPLQVPRRTGVQLFVAGLVLVLVAGSALRNPAFIADPNVVHVQHNGTLFDSAEDEIASVQAGELGGLNLWVAGTSMTVLTVDTKLMPLLPLMARPNATTTLVIAFGMGSAYRSALIAGLIVQGVELVPSVPEMFGYFYPDAASVLANPAGQLAITDGRNYVELTDRTFDIILADPPPPIQSSGTGVLYSREFYQQSAARLTPNGIMMEWVPYGQTVDEFRSHVQTFASVFPNVQLAFSAAGNGVYMMGSSAPIAIDSASARQILSRPGVVADLLGTPDDNGVGLEGWVNLIPKMMWISGEKVREFAGQAPMITDDRPLTEYYLLRNLFGAASPPMTEANLRAVTPP